MNPWICVSLRSRKTEETVETLQKIGSKVDLVEIRLDYREEDINLREIWEAAETPLIGTNRRRDQGGNASEGENERIQLLIAAAENGFNYIDLASSTENLGRVVKQLQTLGAKVIVSHHDYANSLDWDMLEGKYRELEATGCDTVKIVGWVNTMEDNLPYLSFNREHPGNLFFGMGEKGVTSRVLAPLTGALYTYASLKDGEEVAPGQVSYTSLKKIYGSLRI